VKYDFVVIGVGAAGEAAAHLALERGASVAVVDRELFGGSCAFWACIPSKSLLHDAGIHILQPSHSWEAASDRRDWNINREKIPWPDDSTHVKFLEEAGARIIRGTARIDAPGRVAVSREHEADEVLDAGNIIVAIGSQSSLPPIDGLDAAKPWTNREATSARELPKSLLILGGGPTGIELAQVYARFGVPVTLVHSHELLNQRDHPRNSELIKSILEADGVNVMTGVRAGRVRARAGDDGAHLVELSGGGTASGHEILLSIGRTVPTDGLGLENAGVRLHDGKLPADGTLRLAEGVWVAGDPAGPEMHTHLAHYQGEMVVRMALGDDVQPDYRAIPRAIYLDPEIASVGHTLDEASAAGIDAREYSEDVAKTAKGYVADSKGHVTIVVDRAARELAGAFIGGPGASETIHEAVLAIKARTSIDVLADTLHAFPTLARVLGTALVRASRDR
jgi:dihydrolipoamide dehydrogenase